MRDHHKKCPMCNGVGFVHSPVGDVIKTIREERGLTQAGLATMIAMSRPALANIEAGRQDVSATQIISMARILGVSTDYLLGMEAA